MERVEQGLGGFSRGKQRAIKSSRDNRAAGEARPTGRPQRCDRRSHERGHRTPDGVRKTKTRTVNLHAHAEGAGGLRHDARDRALGDGAGGGRRPTGAAGRARSNCAAARHGDRGRRRAADRRPPARLRHGRRRKWPGEQSCGWSGSWPRAGSRFLRGRKIIMTSFRNTVRFGRPNLRVQSRCGAESWIRKHSIIVRADCSPHSKCLCYPNGFKLFVEKALFKVLVSKSRCTGRCAFHVESRFW